MDAYSTQLVSWSQPNLFLPTPTMRAYRAKILTYLTDYEKARTTEEVLTYIAKLKGESLEDMTERRHRSVMSCLRKLEQEKILLTKKQKDGTIYWATKREYLDYLDITVTKIPLKDLIKGARIEQKPIKFFQG